VSVGADDRTLVHCHALQCPPEEITAAVDMTLADLAPPTTGAATSHTERDEVASYDYTDELGTLLFQVVRYEPKDFRCRRPDRRGGWIWNLAGIRVVPYRLPALQKATRAYVVEGERDCDTLGGLGLVATTNHGGAGKWRDEHTQALVTARVSEVIVLRDDDAPGAAHQEAVVRSCRAAGCASSVSCSPTFRRSV
jgi:hypothetical protein